MKAIVLYIFALVFSLHASDGGPKYLSSAVKSQKDLVKPYTLRYLRRLPLQALKCGIHLTGLTKYKYYKNFEPQVFNVFKIHANRLKPSPEWELSFTNSGYEFEKACDVKSDFGFCMGVTSVTRKMNMLAFYDKASEYAQLPLNLEGDAKDKFWRKKIQNMLRSNKPELIPGFDNLKDFSSDPLIKKILLEESIHSWADENITVWNGVVQMLASVRGKFGKSEGRKLYKSIHSRLELGHNPRVWLAKPKDTMWSTNQWIHVMQAYDVSAMAKDGSYTIKVWNPNNKAPYNAQEISIDKNGVPKFKGATLSEVEIINFDDMEIAKILYNKLSFCKKYPKLCKVSSEAI